MGEIASNDTWTEIGYFPSEWNVVKLGSLLEFQNGVNADKSAYGYGTPFINVLEVITQSHIHAAHIAGQVFLPKRAIEAFSVRYGDIVFNRTSETQEEVGLASVYVDDTPVVFGGFVIRGRPKTSTMDAIYSGYMLRGHVVRTQIIGKGQGAIRANIGQQDLRQIIIPLPPLPEQRRIAEMLSDIDAQIAALDALITKKRDIKQGAMQELLTGRRLPGFSGEWKQTTFGDLFAFLQTANNSRSELSSEGSVGYIHYGDIHTKWSTFLDCNQVELPMIDPQKVSGIPNILDGDLIIADASEDYEGLGAAIEVKEVGNRRIVAGLHTLLLRSKTEALVHGFRGYLQYIPEVKKQIIEAGTGVSVYGISKTNLQRVQVDLPSVEEQTAIVTILVDIDNEIAALEKQRNKTADLKQAMMHELLTGKIRLV